MREWTLTARRERAWFVALSAIAGLAIAPALASAQAAEDEAPAQVAPAESEGGDPAEGAPAESAPAEGTPAEGSEPETAPAETAPTETAPTETAPAETAPAETAPADATPADAEAAPATEPAATEPAPTTDPAVTTEETATSEASALQPGDLEAEAEAAQAEEAAPPAREPLPWRNTFFSWTHGVTPNTFIRGAQLSYDPLYYWSFNLSPRWYLDPQTFFVVSQSLSYELTDDGVGSAYNHDLALTDTLVELRRMEAWEGFIFLPAVRVLLPVSKLSRAAQRYFGLGAGLTAVRVIPEAASLTIALIGRYQYWFAGRNTPATMGSYPGHPAPPVLQPEGIVDNPMLDQASGSTSARHIVTAGLNLTVTPVSGLTVSASAFWQSQEGHGLSRACTETLTGDHCIDDQSRTHWRHFTSIALAIAYDVQPWLNLSIGWSNATVLAPLFNADDDRLTDIFNPDNNFFLTATMQIDAVYEALQGSEDDGLTPEQRQRRRQGLAGRESRTGGAF